MKKFIFFTLTGILIIAVSLFMLILATSYPVPEKAEEIIDEVLSSPLPDQIIGDTGTVNANGISIWYESISPSGKAKGTILLIMGLGGNAIEWPLYFIQPLVDAGYHVVRFDNRSTGLSTWTNKRFSIGDMLNDTMALMDALKINQANILGMSMGGIIGQLMAIEHPERVRTLISFMSSGHINDPELPSVSRITYLSLITTGIRHGVPRTEENIVKTTISVRSVLSPELSRQRMKALAEQSLFNQRFRKGFNPQAFILHTKAVRASGSRYSGLQNLKIPVLVIHGKQDPLIHVEHAIKTAQIIPNAELLLLEGMGHDVSPEHTPIMHEAILNFLN